MRVDQLAEHRIVIRPTPGKFILTGLLAAGFGPIAIYGAFAYWGVAAQIQSGALNASTVNALLVVVAFSSAPALITFVLVSGMSIEIDHKTVSKVVLFGAVRRSIPRSQLRWSRRREDDQGFEITMFDFTGSDGSGSRFSAIAFWVWRERDLQQIAAMGRRAP